MRYSVKIMVLILAVAIIAGAVTPATGAETGASVKRIAHYVPSSH